MARARSKEREEIRERQGRPGRQRKKALKSGEQPPSGGNTRRARRAARARSQAMAESTVDSPDDVADQPFHF